MSVKIYRDKDADKSILNNKKIAVIGYGSQGRAQAKMMHESGIKVLVGVRKNGKSWQQAKKDGLKVFTIAEAVKVADIVHILIPDEIQKSVYEKEIKPYLKPGSILSFSHGFNIVFKRIVPPKNMGVIMVAPTSPGIEMYKNYKQGLGVPALISVYQDNVEKNAHKIALAMAKAMFFTKVAVIECSFEQETYQDLFGEQVVLCGGLSELIKTGFEVLVEAGYPAELAYFECVHQIKLIVDLISQQGISGMWKEISNTAEYGARTRAKRIITPVVKKEMKKILKEIENGNFAKQWISETDNNKMKNLSKMRKSDHKHSVEIVGKKIRGMFGN